MTCEKIQPWVSEFADGTLAQGQAQRVREHLTYCTDCARLVEQMQSLKSVLRELPSPPTSPQFEARLAQRIADAHRPAPWLCRLADALALPKARLRPALAAVAATAVIAGGAFSMLQFSGTHTSAISYDPALVSHCVAQHRSDVAAQPLDDPAAQNLIARLDPPNTPDAGASDESL